MTRNLNRTLTTILLLGAYTTLTQASEEEFSLKGITLGAQESVCASAPISSKQELLEAIGVTGHVFPATACELTFDTIAGIKPSGSARLLFWKGRLIRMLVNFEYMELRDAAALRTAFVGLHGKPTVKRNSPFRTDTWRRGMNTLQLAWTDGAALFSVGAYLTDTKGWAEYENSRAKADKLIEALDKKRRSDDLR